MQDRQSARSRVAQTTPPFLSAQIVATPDASGPVYFPNTFFTSPIFFCTLPAAFSAVPRSWRLGLPVALPASSFTLPEISFAVPFTLSVALEFMTAVRFWESERLHRSPRQPQASAGVNESFTKANKGLKCSMAINGILILVMLGRLWEFYQRGPMRRSGDMPQVVD
jgi:hypothetical protein